ncbi:ArsR/SmtB family transcription factor [Rathayibacter agropyri]|uniref:ArsR/SmtB family transcription factor n=1 Tax=Rathayibacter agropyri TaxID=1634927 RepID=UPI00156362D9|nr:metalloregulator ArsR/SmtB family transcription factor [Rathayibacter agropyri]NRD07593.1 helix-turn-helix transcriptional regulator [Rathayibacter agropyri]
MAPRTFHPELGSVDVINLLRAVADPVRLRVFDILDDGNEYTCSALAQRLDIPLPTMSYHLKTLREAGYTRSRKDGTTRWTSLRSDDLDGAFPGLRSTLSTLAEASARQR